MRTPKLISWWGSLTIVDYLLGEVWLNGMCFVIFHFLFVFKFCIVKSVLFWLWLSSRLFGWIKLLNMRLQQYFFNCLLEISADWQEKELFLADDLQFVIYNIFLWLLNVLASNRLVYFLISSLYLILTQNDFILCGMNKMAMFDWAIRTLQKKFANFVSSVRNFDFRMIYLSIFERKVC